MNSSRTYRLHCMILLAMWLAAFGTALAQGGDYDQPVRWDFDFFPPLNSIEEPYAGKYEARIGGSGESVADKLRLDIGASLDLIALREQPDRSRRDVGDVMWTFGADFFTWTRLRAAGGFKFPVEAVDYYFGVNLSSKVLYEGLRKRLVPGGHLIELRFRAGHISAHVTDGDSSFASNETEYRTFSRELVDLLVAVDGVQLFDIRVPNLYIRSAGFRMYAGLLSLVHTIPDTLGVLNPYLGADGHIAFRNVPITLKGGYEARLNAELEPIVEHQLRAGIKVGEYRGSGVTLEGGYYSGRSPYGQHFSEREEYFTIGFAIDY